MNIKKIDFETLFSDDYSFHRVSIVISGNTPELMINETSKYNDGEGTKCETVQLSQSATAALYQELHKIYSAKP